MRNKHSGRTHGEEKPGPVPEGNEHHNVPEGLRHGGEMRRGAGEAAMALGIQMPSCGCAMHCRLEHRDLRQFAGCGRQSSITAGTQFEHAKFPLATWFHGIFLITQCKAGISAMGLMRKIGVSCNAVWRMKHKIMQTDDGARGREAARGPSSGGRRLSRRSPERQTGARGGREDAVRGGGADAAMQGRVDRVERGGDIRPDSRHPLPGDKPWKSGR